MGGDTALCLGSAHFAVAGARQASTSLSAVISSLLASKGGILPVSHWSSAAEGQLPLTPFTDQGLPPERCLLGMGAAGSVVFLCHLTGLKGEAAPRGLGGGGHARPWGKTCGEGVAPAQGL